MKQVIFILIVLIFVTGCKEELENKVDEDVSVHVGRYRSTKLIESKRERIKRHKQNWKTIKGLITRVSSDKLENYRASDEIVYELKQDTNVELWSGSDRRAIVKMPFELREFFLLTMRKNLDRIQLITKMLAESNFSGAEKVANGFVFNRSHLGQLARTGSVAYNVSAIKMQAIAAPQLMKDIRSKNQSKAFAGLGNFMKSCQSCHRSFRFTEWPEEKGYKENGLTTELLLPFGYRLRNGKAGGKGVGEVDRGAPAGGVSN